MPEEIDIPKVPLSRTEQYLTKIVKELSGSDEEVEIPKTTLSRVEMYLKAIIDLLAEAAVKKPITVKGTVENKDELPKTAEVGDMYFVKKGEKSEEFIFTEHGWDPVGDTSVDLSNYLTVEDIEQPLTEKFEEVDTSITDLTSKKMDFTAAQNMFVYKTNFANSNYPGIACINPKFGLYMEGGVQAGINHPYEEDITNGKVNKEHTALTLDRIPQVVNYYIDGKSLEMNDGTHTVQIHHPTVEEIQADGADLEHQALTLDRIQKTFQYYGIYNKTYLNDTYIHTYDYAANNKAGVVIVEPNFGLETLAEGHIAINHPTDEELTNKRVILEKTAITYDRVHDVFDYELPINEYLTNTYATKEEFGKIRIKKLVLDNQATLQGSGHGLEGTSFLLHLEVSIESPYSDTYLPFIGDIRYLPSTFYANILLINKTTGTVITSTSQLPEEDQGQVKCKLTVWYITGIPYTTS